MRDIRGEGKKASKEPGNKPMAYIKIRPSIF